MNILFTVHIVKFILLFMKLSLDNSDRTKKAKGPVFFKDYCCFVNCAKGLAL